LLALLLQHIKLLYLLYKYIHPILIFSDNLFGQVVPKVFLSAIFEHHRLRLAAVPLFLTSRRPCQVFLIQILEGNGHRVSLAHFKPALSLLLPDLLTRLKESTETGHLALLELNFTEVLVDLATLDQPVESLDPALALCKEIIMVRENEVITGVVLWVKERLLQTTCLI
jgi:hypothetical protein